MSSPHRKPKTITIVGSINADLITRTPRLPGPGETLLVGGTGAAAAAAPDAGFEIGWGGKGANQAVACARLGVGRRVRKEEGGEEGEGEGGGKESAAGSSSNDPSQHHPLSIRMHGAVAADAFGPPALASLQENHIDTSAVRILPNPPQSTGIALVLVDTTSGENRILVHAGANSQVTWDGFGAAVPDVVVMQLEVPFDIVKAVVADSCTAQRSSDSGTPVDIVFNPAPAPPGGLEELEGLRWEGVGHLIMNESEAGLLGGQEDGEELDVHAVAARFLKLGVRCVVITLGGSGVYYCKGEPGACEGKIPAAKVKVVDTTAAGDTFVGAYSVEVARSQGGFFDLERACVIANWAAAKTVEKAGAQASIPWLDEVGDVAPT